MPDYRVIYDHQFESDSNSNLAEYSPGFQYVVRAAAELSMISGRALDYGCGAGFAVEYLSGPAFDLQVFGVDISEVAIGRAMRKMDRIPGGPTRLSLLEDQTLTFPDQHFQLVLCFGVLEHLDPVDIDSAWNEMHRVLRPGGTLIGSVSCQASASKDLYGDNLHRTVQSVEEWIGQLSVDSADFDVNQNQLLFRKRIPRTSAAASGTGSAGQTAVNLPAAASASAAAMSAAGAATVGSVANAASAMASAAHSPDTGDPHRTTDLYQKIYDDNPWYGDADQGRCPGMRLLPEYQEWLIGPVIDLGCGRGQTVEHLCSIGMEAEGIDQIRKNPRMRVGDITSPIEDMEKFQSCICVDCIEHLYEEQVLGLFENMKRVKRQAFSIHNGESTGTGQELHVNRKDFVDWTALIRQHFDIASAIQVHPEQVLYLTQTKK